MITANINLYTFEELSKDAQKYAHKEFLNNQRDYSFSKEMLDTINLGLYEFFRLKIKKYEFDLFFPKNSYFTFDTTDCDEKIIEPMSRAEMKKYFKTNSKKFYIQTLQNQDYFYTGICFDLDFTEKIRDVIKNKTTYETLIDLAENCVFKVIEACSLDYEYEHSIEYFKDLCKSNEWMFNKHGQRIEVYQNEVIVR